MAIWGKLWQSHEISWSSLTDVEGKSVPIIQEFWLGRPLSSGQSLFRMAFLKAFYPYVRVACLVREYGQDAFDSVLYAYVGKNGNEIQPSVFKIVC